MDKKDIYEHLAKIYLDASSQGKKKSRRPVVIPQPLTVSVIVLCVLTMGGFVLWGSHRGPRNTSTALILSPDPIKINFNFDPAKKEVAAIDLKKLNLAHYRELAFSLRRANFNDRIHLRVEMVNAYNERSEVYLQDVPHRWGEVRLKFSEFKKISDWGEMKELAFIVEEWNTKEKNGVVLIDNVRFVR